MVGHSRTPSASFLGRSGSLGDTSWLSSADSLHTPFAVGVDQALTAGQSTSQPPVNATPSKPLFKLLFRCIVLLEGYGWLLSLWEWEKPLIVLVAIAAGLGGLILGLPFILLPLGLWADDEGGVGEWAGFRSVSGEGFGAWLVRGASQTLRLSQRLRGQSQSQSGGLDSDPGTPTLFGRQQQQQQQQQGQEPAAAAAAAAGGKQQRGGGGGGVSPPAVTPGAATSSSNSGSGSTSGWLQRRLTSGYQAAVAGLVTFDRTARRLTAAYVDAAVAGLLVVGLLLGTVMLSVVLVVQVRGLEGVWWGWGEWVVGTEGSVRGAGGQWALS
jgi:hypothetical protein